MKLIIVESPTKAKTISKFLNSEFVVKASMGHVVDLPKSKLGIDLENNFAPQYEVTPKGIKILAELKKLAKDAEEIYIATDPDREGEAIGQNLKEELVSSKTKINAPFFRIQFHEITKEAIDFALKNPQEINLDLVNSQQARRVLDRIVGYKLSPLLWKKVRYGLSAGRVQSVALRLIVEREKERQQFKPQEYWSFSANFESKKDSAVFLTELKKINGKDFLISSVSESQEIEKQVKECETHKIVSKEIKEVKKYPYPPFTTSTLQQSAGNLFGFSAKKTMTIAQKLYEQGLITYHRTDSFNLSESFINSSRDYILKTMGKEYLPEKPNYYKTKSKSAQEAHEAIRPTDVEVTSYKVKESNKSHKSNESYENYADFDKLYKLIWKRAVSCQMVPAVYNQFLLKIESVGKSTFLFGSSKQAIKFLGFLKVYQDGEELSKDTLDQNSFSKGTEGDILNIASINGIQHFTEPSARYQTASLIKVLEEYGIGRPSTYASIISTIESRGYILKEGRYFYPDDVAFVVCDLLSSNFPEVIDTNFTAKMEEELDKIAGGELNTVSVIKDFWEPFKLDLEKADSTLKKSDFTTLAKTEEKCPDCNFPLVVKLGRFGKFLSCSNFPNCKFIKSLVLETGENCPDCKEGRVIVRKTKKGKTFYGCSNYPKCKWASWTKPESKVVS